KGLAAAVRGKLLSAGDSHARHGEVIAAVDSVLGAVLDADGVTVDSDMGVHYATQTAFLHVPALAETLGQAQSLAMAMLAAKAASSEDRTAVGAIVDRVKERSQQVRNAIAKAFEANERLKPK